MNKNCQLPPLNTLRLFPANRLPAAKYNTFPFDLGFFATQQIRDFYQQKVEYFQKFQGDQIITFYVDSLAPNLKISLINVWSEPFIETVLAPAEIPFVSLAGNVDGTYGNPYNTFFDTYSFDDIAHAGRLPDGIYCLLIEELYAAAGDAANRLIVSEPFQYRLAGWEDTMLIEYGNETNDYDVLFEQLGDIAQFAFRAEMVFEKIEPGVHSTSFEDMLFEIVKLEDAPYRVFTLTVGGEHGVPPWVLDKINRMLCCDTIIINGIKFRKETNANWSIKTIADSPLMAGTVLLREEQRDGGWEFSNFGEADTTRWHDGFHDGFHD